MLAGLPKYQLDRLQLVMNSAARLVTSTSKYEHITPILGTLHWLPIEQRVSFKITCLAYKSIHGLAPSYLTQLLKWYTPVRSLRSADKDLLVVPKIRTKKYGSRTFAHAASIVYNSVPLEIHQSPSLESFKTRLKTHLFVNVFN